MLNNLRTYTNVILSSFAMGIAFRSIVRLYLLQYKTGYLGKLRILAILMLLKQFLTMIVYYSIQLNGDLSNPFIMVCDLYLDYIRLPAEYLFTYLVLKRSQVLSGFAKKHGKSIYLVLGVFTAIRLTRSVLIFMKYYYNVHDLDYQNSLTSIRNILDALSFFVTTSYDTLLDLLFYTKYVDLQNSFKSFGLTRQYSVMKIHFIFEIATSVLLIVNLTLTFVYQGFSYMKQVSEVYQSFVLSDLIEFGVNVKEVIGSPTYHEVENTNRDNYNHDIYNRDESLIHGRIELTAPGDSAF